MSILERLSPGDQRRVLALTEVELAHARASPANPSAWSALARPEQLPPPGSWRTWLILAGRGWGKTRTGGETIAAWAAAGTARRIAVVAQTHADVRDLSMRVLRAAAGPRKGKPSSCALPATAPACAPALGSVGAGSGNRPCPRTNSRAASRSRLASSM